MAEIVIGQTMAVACCWKCGIIYAVPACWDKNRAKDGRTMWCPNGHASVYRKDTAKESLSGRQDEILRLHEQEQAEARAEDAKGKTAPVAASSVADAFAAAERDAHAVPEVDGRRECPHCGKRLPSLKWLSTHLRKLHPDKLRSS